MLIAALRQAGCRIRYHGELDPAGLHIANLLIPRFAVDPWKMTAADLPTAPSPAPPLHGTCPPATWDNSLSPSWLRRPRRERVLEPLLNALPGK